LADTDADGFEVIGVTPATVLKGGTLSAGGGLLLQVRSAIQRLGDGQVLEVQSAEPAVKEELAAWSRLTGNQMLADLDAGDHTRYFIRKGASGVPREKPDWGIKLPRRPGGRLDMRDWFVGRLGDVPEEAPAYLGFVPRGAVREPGMPEFPYTLNRRPEVWADNIADLYEQATAQQWNASTDIAWDSLPRLPDDVERAVCQVMTFLAENEYAALYIPSRFLPRINAQYTEVVLFLATVINDEARHIEAFTKRAVANGGGLQYSASLTEWSLHSLLVQEDYFQSSFLLHVLGEGTFLDLLDFLARFAPDPVTADVVRRARQDEGRHVAYGIAHVREQLRADPTKSEALVTAAEERSAVLQATTGANPMVMEALAIISGGGSLPEQMARGVEAVRALFNDMHEYRVRRMLQLGLDEATAQKISRLHTPNFM